MARLCVNCGRSVGPLSGRMRYRLKDPDTWICRKCLFSLGFDKDNAAISTLYSWDDIKDGADAYYSREIDRRAAAWDAENTPSTSPSTSPSGSFGIHFANYGQERDPNPTQHETELFGLICQALKDNGKDADIVRLVRKSETYLTAAVDECDVCRFKYTQRAKWIQFPYDRTESGKRYITAVALMPDDIAALLKAFDFALATSSRPSYTPHR